MINNPKWVGDSVKAVLTEKLILSPLSDQRSYFEM